MSDSADIQPLDVPSGGIPKPTNLDINDAVSALGAGRGPFVVDTEHAMDIRYSERTYVIQIHRKDTGTLLISPIGTEDRLGPLAELLVTDVWVLHAIDQGLPYLRELGFNPPEIFNTEIAGILLGFERISLQAEVTEVLGYGLAKEHSMADWSERPLTPELRAYVTLDVELFIELRERLTAILRAAEHLG